MGRKRKDGKFVNCYISTNIAETLDNVSEETGRSKTRIIEDALVEHFTSQGFPLVGSESVVTIEQDRSSPFKSKLQAILATNSGDIECQVLEELTIYGETYYRVQVGDEVKKVHSSMVKFRPS